MNNGKAGEPSGVDINDYGRRKSWYQGMEWL